MRVTDLCRWPGWGGAAAAPWRSPRAAPQLASLGGGRTGRCGLGPSAGATPARPPFPDPPHLPAPPVCATGAPRCPRRWAERRGMSRACQCPDLERRRRWGRGSEVSGCIRGGLQRSRCVTRSERGRLKKQRATWHCDWAAKTLFLISQLMLLTGRNKRKYIKILSRKQVNWWAQTRTTHFRATDPRNQLSLRTSVLLSAFSNLKPFNSLFSSRKIALTITRRIIIHGTPLMASGPKLRKPKPLWAFHQSLDVQTKSLQNDPRLISTNR